MNITGDIRRVWSDHPDWSQIIELDKKYFPRPWNNLDWLGLNPSHHYLYTWVKEGEPLGYALFQGLKGDEVAHLLKILMIPGHQGTGETLKFWEKLVESIKTEGFGRMYLEVESMNLRAQGFYKKMGFQDIRVVRNYYADGMDAFVMDLTL